MRRMINRRRFLTTSSLMAWTGVQAWAEPPLRIAASVVGPQAADSWRLTSRHDPPQGAVVAAITIAPDGQLLAVACNDFTIRILTMDTVAEVATLAGHRDSVRTLDFDATSERLVSAGNDGQLMIWSRSAWTKPPTSVDVTPAIASARFSPDGKRIVAVGFDNQVLLIEPARPHRTSITCGCCDLRVAAFRPDGMLLAVGGRSGEIHLVDPVNGSSQGDFQVHRGRIRGMKFQCDGEHVATVGEDGFVAVFNTSRREVVQSVQVTTARLFALAAVDDQYLAVAGSDDVIRIVDLVRGQVVRKFVGHQGSVTALAANRGDLFSGGFDATLRRWPVAQLLDSTERIAEGSPALER